MVLSINTVEGNLAEIFMYVVCKCLCVYNVRCV